MYRVQEVGDRASSREPRVLIWGKAIQDGISSVLYELSNPLFDFRVQKKFRAVGAQAVIRYFVPGQDLFYIQADFGRKVV